MVRYLYGSASFLAQKLLLVQNSLETAYLELLELRERVRLVEAGAVRKSASGQQTTFAKMKDPAN
jgi:hypothetical protein